MISCKDFLTLAVRQSVKLDSGMQYHVFHRTASVMSFMQTSSSCSLRGVFMIFSTFELDKHYPLPSRNIQIACLLSSFSLCNTLKLEIWFYNSIPLHNVDACSDTPCSNPGHQRVVRYPAIWESPGQWPTQCTSVSGSIPSFLLPLYPCIWESTCTPPSFHPVRNQPRPNLMHLHFGT